MFKNTRQSKDNISPDEAAATQAASQRDQEAKKDFIQGIQADIIKFEKVTSKSESSMLLNSIRSRIESIESDLADTLNTSKIYGDTLLHQLVKNNNNFVDLVPFLISKGANSALLDGGGYSPVYYLCTARNPIILIIRDILKDDKESLLFLNEILIDHCYSSCTLIERLILNALKPDANEKDWQLVEVSLGIKIKTPENFQFSSVFLEKIASSGFLELELVRQFIYDVEPSTFQEKLTPYIDCKEMEYLMRQAFESPSNESRQAVIVRLRESLILPADASFSSDFLSIVLTKSFSDVEWFFEFLKIEPAGTFQSKFYPYIACKNMEDLILKALQSSEDCTIQALPLELLETNVPKSIENIFSFNFLQSLSLKGPKDLKLISSMIKTKREETLGDRLVAQLKISKKLQIQKAVTLSDVNLLDKEFISVEALIEETPGSKSMMVVERALLNACLALDAYAGKFDTFEQMSKDMEEKHFNSLSILKDILSTCIDVPPSLALSKEFVSAIRNITPYDLNIIRRDLFPKEIDGWGLFQHKLYAFFSKESSIRECFIIEKEAIINLITIGGLDSVKEWVDNLTEVLSLGAVRRLIEAVENAPLDEKVKHSLKNTIFSSGKHSRANCSLMHHAIYCRDAAYVRYLLEHGYNDNETMYLKTDKGSPVRASSIRYALWAVNRDPNDQISVSILKAFLLHLTQQKLADPKSVWPQWDCQNFETYRAIVNSLRDRKPGTPLANFRDALNEKYPPRPRATNPNSQTKDPSMARQIASASHPERAMPSIGVRKPVISAAKTPADSKVNVSPAQALNGQRLGQQSRDSQSIQAAEPRSVVEASLRQVSETPEPVFWIAPVETIGWGIGLGVVAAVFSVASVVGYPLAWIASNFFENRRFEQALDSGWQRLSARWNTHVRHVPEVIAASNSNNNEETVPLLAPGGSLLMTPLRPTEPAPLTEVVSAQPVSPKKL